MVKPSTAEESIEVANRTAGALDSAQRHPLWSLCTLYIVVLLLIPILSAAAGASMAVTGHPPSIGEYKANESC